MKLLCFIFLGGAMLLVGFGPSPKSKPQTHAGNNSQATAAPDASEPTAQPSRLDWNREMFVADYERNGRHGPQWDAAAKRALETYAQYRAAIPTQRQTLKPSLVDAITVVHTAGCEDPFLEYLYLNFVAADGKPGTPAQKKQFRSLAQTLLQDPKRAAIGTYFCAVHGIEPVAETPVLSAEALATNSTWLAQGEERSKRVFEDMAWESKTVKLLLAITSDPRTPPGEIYDTWELWFGLSDKHNADHYAAYLQAQKTIFTNWPAEACLYLQKGRFYIEHAWRVRGNGWADTVSPKAWGEFSNRLEVAEQALGRAWSLDPRDGRIAREMIRVELGQGRGRDRMELWFNRAMELDPSDFEACCNKLNYLQPKWYGSWKDVFQFATECVHSSKWKGRVPLIMVAAHQAVAGYLEDTEASTYWKRPQVWQSIQAAYEQFARLNPQESHWRNTYALYAFKAGQWSEFNRQLAALKQVDYTAFGGKAAFDKMVEIARSHGH